jgi:hypothetical protein
MDDLTAFPKHLRPILREITQKLGEHFDAFQFLGSFVDDGGDTGNVAFGKGNWYARVGMAHEFLETDRSTIQAKELSSALSHDEGGEEGYYGQD